MDFTSSFIKVYEFIRNNLHEKNLYEMVNKEFEEFNKDYKGLVLKLISCKNHEELNNLHTIIIAVHKLQSSNLSKEDQKQIISIVEEVSYIYPKLNKDNKKEYILKLKELKTRKKYLFDYIETNKLIDLSFIC